MWYVLFIAKEYHNSINEILNWDAFFFLKTTKIIIDDKAKQIALLNKEEAPQGPASLDELSILQRSLI